MTEINIITLHNLKRLNIENNKVSILNLSNLINLNYLYTKNNIFLPQKILSRRRIYLLAELKGTWNRLMELKGPCEGSYESFRKEISEDSLIKCSRCNKNIDQNFFINIRHSIWLNNKISYYSCC